MSGHPGTPLDPNRFPCALQTTTSAFTGRVARSAQPSGRSSAARRLVVRAESTDLVKVGDAAIAVRERAPGSPLGREARRGVARARSPEG